MLAIIQDANRFEPRVLKLAREVTTPGRLFAWCKRRITFQRDPAGHEYIRTPGIVLGQVQRLGRAAIDCDDLAALACSVLAALGYAPVIIVIGRIPRDLGGRYEHVLGGFLRDPSRPPTRSNIVPFDPQETREIGTWPRGTIVRMTQGTQEHAA
jgi:hypothetical protein